MMLDDKKSLDIVEIIVYLFCFIVWRIKKKKRLALELSSYFHLKLFRSAVSMKTQSRKSLSFSFAWFCSLCRD